MIIYMLLLYAIIWMCMWSFLWKLSDWSSVSMTKRSKCDTCSHALHRYELIPIVSRIAQCGKCRYCNNTISSDYLVSELLSGLVFTIVWYVARVFPFLIQLQICLIVAIMLFLCFYDVRKKELSLIAFILLCISIIGLYLSYLSWNTWSEYGTRTALRYIPYEQYSWLMREIWISVYSWWWTWFLVWLLWVLIYYNTYKSLGQWFGFGDVLFAFSLWWLLPFVMITIPMFVAAWLKIEHFAMRNMSLIIYHLLFSSVLWIIWYGFFKKSEFAFLPYMLWWFLFLAIAIFIFPNYFITVLGG